MKLLEVRGLRKRFRDRHFDIRRTDPVEALRGVSLWIEEGEVLGLVGESGSGKSTLAKCVLGLEQPTEGQILFQGEPLSTVRNTSPGRIQAVFQDPTESLNPTMSVLELIREPLDILNRQPRSARELQVQKMIEQVGLGRELIAERPHRLSGGQKQRVAIARALVAEPSLLVADEAVSALDVSVQAQILNLLLELRRQLKLTILFISHDLEVVGQVCDRIAVMTEGKLVEVAPSARLFSSPGHPYTRTLLAAIVPLAPAAAREWIDSSPPAWQGEPGKLEEIAPDHWVAAS